MIDHAVINGHVSLSMEDYMCHCRESVELAEWRSGKRRVFWRVYDVGVTCDLYAYGDFSSKAEARHRMRLLTDGAKLYRVTIRPKRKL
jgi:hypothetical protein